MVLRVCGPADPSLPAPLNGKRVFVLSPGTCGGAFHGSSGETELV